MTHRYLSLLLVGLLALSTLPGCSGKGDDVIDAQSSDRKEVALLAIGTDGNGSALMRYDETTATMVADDYLTANGEALDLPIDAMYQSNDKIYLHHRAAGAITVLDVTTRKKLARITGFPSGDDGALCGMAFSNYSDVWVVCHGSKNLYHVDGVNLKLVRAISLPGDPTTVGTSGDKIFVGMILPDGRSQVAVILSTSGTSYPIWKTIDFSEPILHAVGTPEGELMVFLSAGDKGADPNSPDDDVRPALHYYLLSSMSLDADAPIEAPAMTDYIGREPTYISYTQAYLMYIAAPNGLTLVDTRGRVLVPGWAPGNYTVVGADPYTAYVYAYDADQNVVQRFTPDGEQYDPLTPSAPTRAILFLNSNKVQ